MSGALSLLVNRFDRRSFPGLGLGCDCAPRRVAFLLVCAVIVAMSFFFAKAEGLQMRLIPGDMLQTHRLIFTYLESICIKRHRLLPPVCANPPLVTGLFPWLVLAYLRDFVQPRQHPCDDVVPPWPCPETWFHLTMHDYMTGHGSRGHHECV